MDENGEILLLHASKNSARPLVLPCALYTLVFVIDIRECFQFLFIGNEEKLSFKKTKIDKRTIDKGNFTHFILLKYLNYVFDLPQHFNFAFIEIIGHVKSQSRLTLI